MNGKKKRKPRAIDVLGERMKGYETAANESYELDKALPAVARIDGHKFSTFTRGFKRPFDRRIHTAMVNTTMDLVGKFEARTGYTQSDEITLIFPPCEGHQTFMFKGKITKISSLLSSYASVRFAFHISREEYAEDEPNLRKKCVVDPQMHFDARIFNVPHKGEALNNIIWRSLFDCRRNSVFNLAHCNFSTKELKGVGTTGCLKKLKEKGIEWEDMPPSFKYGTFVKKQLFQKEALDRKTGEIKMVDRGRVVEKAFKISGYTDEGIEFLFQKYYPDVLPENLIEDHKDFPN